MGRQAGRRQRHSWGWDSSFSSRWQVMADSYSKSGWQSGSPVSTHISVAAVQSEEPVSSVVLLAQHLEASNLQDFWAATNSCKDTIKQGGQAHMVSQTCLWLITYLLSMACMQTVHWLKVGWRVDGAMHSLLSRLCSAAGRWYIGSQGSRCRHIALSLVTALRGGWHQSLPHSH